jgi:hypothetical protein
MVLGEFGGLGLRVAGHAWAEKAWGYVGMPDEAGLAAKAGALWAEVGRLKAAHGLSAAVYTQLTDVETECNGLLTYDRAVIKIDAARHAGFLRPLLARPATTP